MSWSCGRLRRAPKHAPKLATALLAATAACSDPADTPTSEQVEIFSWWVSGGEVDALNALIAVYHEQHPTVEVDNLAIGFADQARDELSNRMASGLPPDTFQANVGWGLLSWAPNALEPLDPLAAKHGWAGAFEPAVLDSASLQGELYGVPLNIHRINALFYNRDVLAQHGVDPPTSLEDLHAACLTLKAAGVTPIALGNLNGWPLQELAFECVLPAVAGGTFCERYWQGLEQADASEVRQTLEYVIALQRDGCFNDDSATIDWGNALDRVADGSAAFSEMGDWAKGYLESRGEIANEDFGVVPFPGTQGVFVFTSDTFPLPRGAKNRSNAVDLLVAMASTRGQQAFNRVKGSIPARIDIDPSSFDPMQRTTYEDWKHDQKVLAMSGLLRPDVMLDLSVKLKDGIAIGDSSQVLTYLTHNYGTLK